MTDLKKEFNELLNVRKREVDNLSKEYLMLFAEYYNENRFAAFSTYVTLRNETENRILEVEEHLSIKNNNILTALKRAIEKEAEQLDTNEDDYTEIVDEVNRFLSSLLNKPNFNLYTDIYKTIDLYKPNYSSLDSEFPYKWMSDIDELIGHSMVLYRARVLNGTATIFIKNIIDYGLPIEISKDNTHYLLDGFKVEVPVEIPSKDEIYLWYEKLRNEPSNTVEKAFHKLITLIKDRQLDIKRYIRTDTPENFDRGYRAWYKKNRNKNSEK